MLAYTCALAERAKAELALLKGNKKGVTALEYGVIASVAVVALLAAFQAFYGAFDGIFTTVTGKITPS
jgi:Flp pilus assembly pilin Flp